MIVVNLYSGWLSEWMTVVVVRRSSFVVRRSSFVVRRFVGSSVRRFVGSSFVVRRSSLRSSFDFVVAVVVF